ncbi:peptidase m28 [Zobellia laminariae]|nr:peptidase m28 [Zobellia laminariae]
MKNLVFGLLACATLLAVSCDSSNTAEDDSLYQTNSIDKKTAEIDGGRH